MSTIMDIKELSEGVERDIRSLLDLITDNETELPAGGHTLLQELKDNIDTLDTTIQEDLEEEWEDRWDETEAGEGGWINTDNESGWVNIEHDDDYAYNGDGEYGYCDDCDRPCADDIEVNRLFVEEFGHVQTQTTHIPFITTDITSHTTTDSAVRIIPVSGVQWGPPLDPIGPGTPFESDGDRDNPEDYSLEEPLDMNYGAITGMMEAFGYRPMTRPEAEAYFKAKANPQLANLMESLMVLRNQEVT